MQNGKIGNGTKVHRILTIMGKKHVSCGAGTRRGWSSNQIENSIRIVDMPVNCSKCLEHDNDNSN